MAWPGIVYDDGWRKAEHFTKSEIRLRRDDDELTKTFRPLPVKQRKCCMVRCTPSATVQ